MNLTHVAALVVNTGASITASFYDADTNTFRTLTGRETYKAQRMVKRLEQRNAAAKVARANRDRLEFIAMAAREAQGKAECWQGCGWQIVTNEIATSGFAGGACYYAELACGHTNADESNDVLAAV